MLCNIMYNINTLILIFLQELLWRTNLLSGHFDQWTRRGFEYDESIKADFRKPAQEALMKLFAVSFKPF